jgi:hypothetical protein
MLQVEFGRQALAAGHTPLLLDDAKALAAPAGEQLNCEGHALCDCICQGREPHDPRVQPRFGVLLNVGVDLSQLQDTDCACPSKRHVVSLPTFAAQWQWTGAGAHHYIKHQCHIFSYEIRTEYHASLSSNINFWFCLNCSVSKTSICNTLAHTKVCFLVV